jgi:predicted ATPase
MAYPGAWISELSETAIERVDFEGTDHVGLLRAVLDDRARFVRAGLED